MSVVGTRSEGLAALHVSEGWRASGMWQAGITAATDGHKRAGQAWQERQRRKGPPGTVTVGCSLQVVLTESSLGGPPTGNAQRALQSTSLCKAPNDWPLTRTDTHCIRITHCHLQPCPTHPHLRLLPPPPPLTSTCADPTQPNNGEVGSTWPPQKSRARAGLERFMPCQRPRSHAAPAAQACHATPPTARAPTGCRFGWTQGCSGCSRGPLISTVHAACAAPIHSVPCPAQRET